MAAAQHRLHLLGIRHHGPGSALSVRAALDAVDPEVVLIEGPPDANEVLRFAASPDMVPPVALLVHAQDDPSNASFYPFAAYSPEWVAARWALAKGRSLAFIDLPAAQRLAEIAADKAALAAAETAPPEAANAEPVDAIPQAAEPEPGASASAVGEPDPAATIAARIHHDSLGYLAEIAGYTDSEAWWNALIEQGAHGPAVFAAIETAMTELRALADAMPWTSPRNHAHEARREAHMRLAIAAALEEAEGAIAVVCGAWHVPALRRKVSAAEDRALLKGLAKLKVTATWIPWSDTRLASASGYGAGVISPGWYAHLWHELGGSQPHGSVRPEMFAARWQARVAGLLRGKGHITSTASVIEASRLALSLAAIRDLALPGLDEMREATLATLCNGETTQWRLIEDLLVIGRAIGEIDDAVPQMPLAADLARQQKKLKLKPEALDNDISLDLRTDTGLAKSTLLHRLNLIELPWGRMTGTGSSRGTFRENWRIKWEPEFAIKLAEALIYGTTVEQASGNAAVARAKKATSLGVVAAIVTECLHAGLNDAARSTIALLQAQASASSDVKSLAAAVPPLANILRYGSAREIPTDELRLLVTSITEVICAGLDIAGRSLQAEEASGLRVELGRVNDALTLLDTEALTTSWRQALMRLADTADAHPLLRGFAVRILYERSALDGESAGAYISRALSRAVAPLEAGQWLEGFLGGSGVVLVHDRILRAIIDQWICGLGDDDFMLVLAMLRRAFSTLDRMERRRLIDELRKAQLSSGALPSQPSGADDAPSAPGFAAALPLLLAILGAAPPVEVENAP